MEDIPGVYYIDKITPKSNEFTRDSEHPWESTYPMYLPASDGRLIVPSRGPNLASHSILRLQESVKGPMESVYANCETLLLHEFLPKDHDNSCEACAFVESMLIQLHAKSWMCLNLQNSVGAIKDSQRMYVVIHVYKSIPNLVAEGRLAINPLSSPAKDLGTFFHVRNDFNKYAIRHMELLERRWDEVYQQIYDMIRRGEVVLSFGKNKITLFKNVEPPSEKRKPKLDIRTRRKCNHHPNWKRKHPVSQVH